MRILTSTMSLVGLLAIVTSSAHAQNCNEIRFAAKDNIEDYCNIQVGILDPAGYGPNTLHNGPDYNDINKYSPKHNMVRWRFTAQCDGKYAFWVQYANGDSRYVSVLVNGLPAPDALKLTTGGFNVKDQKLEYQYDVHLKPGDNTLQFDAADFFPHITEIHLVPK